MYEAKGNEKYKTKLERLVEPLYKQEPALSTAMDALQEMISSNKMTHAITRDYNTERRWQIFARGSRIK